MLKTNQYCDRCEKLLVENNNKIHSLNGVCFELGYSVGGWGERRDFAKFSGEVCDDCFNAYRDLAALLRQWKSGNQNDLTDK